MVFLLLSTSALRRVTAEPNLTLKSRVMTMPLADESQLRGRVLANKAKNKLMAWMFDL
jgi:hypothetical protein